MIALHVERLRPLATEEPITRQLRVLSEQKCRLVADRTQTNNRLRATLKCYHPLALVMVGNNEPLTRRKSKFPSLGNPRPEQRMSVSECHGGLPETADFGDAGPDTVEHFPLGSVWCRFPEAHLLLNPVKTRVSQTVLGMNYAGWELVPGEGIEPTTKGL